MAAVLLAAAACSSPDAAARSADPGGRAAASPTTERQDADRLGRRVFHLLDEAAAYRSSHRERLPASVAQLGLDSLTPDMVLRLSTRNDSSVARAAFRRLDGRSLAWCEATAEALEEASLNAGAFTVLCQRPGAAADSFTIGGSE